MISELAASFYSWLAPVRRSFFIRCFVYQAVIFVPAVFFFGSGRIVAPGSYVLFALLFEKRHDHGSMLGWTICHVLFYGLIYYLLARLVYASSLRAVKKQTQLAIQIGALLVVFLCSFLPLIERQSWRPSGTYNFWTACLRYYDHYLPISWDQ